MEIPEVLDFSPFLFFLWQLNYNTISPHPLKSLTLHRLVQGEFRFRDFFYKPFFLETFYGPYIWVSRPGKLF